MQFYFHVIHIYFSNTSNLLLEISKWKQQKHI